LRGIPSMTVCSPDLGNAQHLACEARYTILPSAVRVIMRASEIGQREM
jgi:hypothetical protein